MAEVPVSLEDMEEIVGLCAIDLAEMWAIEQDISESETESLVNLAVDVVAFVISRYMEHMNLLMDGKARDVGIIDA